MRKPKQLPILFSTDMVRAILDGRKTQTRRVITSNNTVNFSIKKNLLDFSEIHLNGQFGVKVKEQASDALWRGECKWQPGDILYVRETWRPKSHNFPIGFPFEYKATAEEDGVPVDDPWKPSIHMPKNASRIWLRVKRSWGERIQHITQEDAITEGIKTFSGATCNPYQNYLKREDDPSTLHCSSPIKSFETLWDSINKSRGYGWDENPAVWAEEFEIISTTGKPEELK